VAEQSQNARIEMAAYLDALALKEAPDDVARSCTGPLGDIARAKGMTQVAKDTGLSRESLLSGAQRRWQSKLATVLR